MNVWNFALLILMTCPNFAGEPDAVIKKDIDAIFESWTKQDVPGGSLGIVQDGELVYSRGYGMANLEYGLSNNSRSIFRIASTSKQFTAATVALLAESGVLSLDEDIRTYLPNFPKYEHVVTIRHLIHHTSGVRDYLGLMSLAGYGDADTFQDEDALAMINRQKKLSFEPGTQWSYSNSGYFLLSCIIAKVTGKTLAEKAEELIFKPLNMKHSFFNNDHTQIVKNRASGYAPTENGFRISMTTLDMIGDGGVFTSVEDLVQWDRNFYNNRLGKGDPNFIKQLTTPAKLKNDENSEYGFGLFIGEYRGEKIVEHGGAFVGYRAMMLQFPEKKVTILLLCNRSDGNPGRRAFRVADAFLFGGPEKKPEPAKAQANSKKPEFKLSSEKLAAFTGSYLGDLGKIEIESTGKALNLIRGDSNFLLKAVGPMDFEDSDGPRSASFSDINGRLHLSVKINGRSFDFKSIPAYIPTPGEQKALVGSYYSQELDVTWQVWVHGGEIRLKTHDQNEEDPLDPIQVDQFSFDGLNLQFKREKGQVTGFTLEGGRISGLLFIRKK